MRIVRAVLTRVALGFVVLALGGCGAGPETPLGQAPPPESAEVWAVGDGSDGGEAARRVARLIARARPDRLIYLGDVYHRTDEEEERGVGEEVSEDQRQDLGFENFAADYGRLLSITLPTPGNHDGGGYHRFWQRHRTVRPWTRTELAGWSLLGLNSETGYEAGSPQLRWLERQMARPGTCRLAYWHSPRHSRGKYEGEGERLAALWSTLAGHATLVLNAHDHNMQRLRPIDGITVLISGAGGHSSYDVDEDDRDLVFGTDAHDGALRLELSPGRARFTFVSVDGTVLHAGEVPCRRG